MSTGNMRDEVFLARDALRPNINTQLSSITNWCEYGIWGMTLHDDQSPWFTLIECLQVIHSQGAKGGEVFPGLTRAENGTLGHEHVKYSVPININLRHLLFRDREVSRLTERMRPDEGPMWRELTQKAAETDKRHQIDLSYLQRSFGEFGKLAKTIDVLRAAEVESAFVERWTSRHLLPLGPAMLFADVNDTNLRPDKRVFRRTGEMLYMMLNRARDGLRRDLERLVVDRIVKLRHPLNGLSARLAAPDWDKGAAGGTAEFSTGYLPVARMSVYDNLAEDWIALLSLDMAQVEDLLDPLMRLSTLHQLNYVIHRGWAETGAVSPPPPIVFDLSGMSRRNPVQQLAAEQYGYHRHLPIRAAEAFVDRYAEGEEWTKLVTEHTGREKAYRQLRSRFLWPKNDGVAPLSTTLPEPEGQRQKLLETFQTAQNHTVWSFMASHGRRAGMVMARQRAGTWYAPNESFLEALVLANVTKAQEFGTFLQRLYSRYGIVIGAEQARQAFPDSYMSIEPFKANQVRLEERLAVLGYIDRKSDDCAFVRNPYYRNGGAGQAPRQAEVAA